MTHYYDTVVFFFPYMQINTAASNGSWNETVSQRQKITCNHAFLSSILLPPSPFRIKLGNTQQYT